MKKIAVIIVIAFVCFGFAKLTNVSNEDPEFIPASKQRSGDAAKGYEYLTTGDYLKSGIPYSLFTLGIPKDSNNFLNRTGINKTCSL